jgi:hypothetical protein
MANSDGDGGEVLKAMHELHCIQLPSMLSHLEDVFFFFAWTHNFSTGQMLHMIPFHHLTKQTKQLTSFFVAQLRITEEMSSSPSPH